MPTCPRNHPLAVSPEPAVRARPIPPRDGVPDATAAPPCRVAGPSPVPPSELRPAEPPPAGRLSRRLADQDGSVATEYGLLAVVAATIVSVLLEWATGGGITALLSSILARVSELVGL